MQFSEKAPHKSRRKETRRHVSERAVIRMLRNVPRKKSCLWLFSDQKHVALLNPSDFAHNLRCSERNGGRNQNIDNQN